MSPLQSVQRRTGFETLESKKLFAADLAGGAVADFQSGDIQPFLMEGSMDDLADTALISEIESGKLTPTPNGSSFSGWSGCGCSGTGTCTITTDQARNITMDQARNVTATFGPSHTLNVSLSVSGSGTVTSSPDSGINCGNDCNETYTDGTPVTLTVEATSGSSFYGWGGDGDLGSGSCTITVDNIENKDLIVEHNLVPNLGGQEGEDFNNPNLGGQEGEPVVTAVTPNDGLSQVHHIKPHGSAGSYSDYPEVTEQHEFGGQEGEPVVAPHNQHLVDHIFEQVDKDHIALDSANDRISDALLLTYDSSSLYILE